ncbi:hypothetical protein [Arcanobacterium haemolyticum]|nr:hypothetical protein [Arcanobacterium haemolyticum]
MALDNVSRTLFRLNQHIACPVVVTREENHPTQLASEERKTLLRVEE